MNTEIMIRKMTEEDCEEVWELQKTCFSTPWSLESIREMFITEGYLSLIALEYDSIVGYIGIKEIGERRVGKECRSRWWISLTWVYILGGVAGEWEK